MKRFRIATTVLATMVISAILPVVPALASANATARLTNNAAVYPGTYTYSLLLSNTEPAGLLSSGRAINYFIVELPQGAGIALGDGSPLAGGFTAEKTRVGSTDWVIFSNSSLAPGQTLNIDIPAVAKTPSRCDTFGTWRVRVSSDGGQTLKTASAAQAGALESRVQVLEILPGSFDPIAPTNSDGTRGVTDGSGTAGQLITYEFKVKNHASSPLSVRGSMTSDTIDAPINSDKELILGGGGTDEFQIPVQLGPASVQRTASFTADAVSKCATAPEAASDFDVQVPVDIQFTGVDPNRVRSGANSGTTFSITAVKTGGAGFELSQGSLAFGGNTATLQGAPRMFNAGNHNLVLQYATSQVVGTEGPLSATTTSLGEDLNLAPVNIVRSAGTITIDVTAPVVTIARVTLPEDADGDQQIAVKRGDTVMAAGTVLGGDLSSGCPRVTAVPNAGPSRDFTVTCSSTSEGLNWSGSLSGAGTQWDQNATAFSVMARMSDLAGNEGTAADNGPWLIDMTAPQLGGYADQFKGLVLDPTSIAVFFEDNLGFVRGGCDPESWLVDGQPGQVRSVRLPSGQDCSDDDPNRRSLTKGTRVLVLGEQFAKQPHETPTVSYSQRPRTLGFYPAKDGAANDALNRTIQTLTSVIPPTPQITEVERSDGNGFFEPAFFDNEEFRYYTNVGGSEGVRLSWSFMTQRTVPEVEGYTIRITDASGNVLNETPVSGQDILSGEWSGTSFVPLPTSDGSYTRRLFVVSPAGNLSDPNSLTIVLDTVRPVISSSTFDGLSMITAVFSEKIVAGTNFGRDWVIGYEIEGPEGPEIATTQADSVDVIDEFTRRLVIDLADPSSYRSTDYRLSGATSERYEDRAGNVMHDTI